MDSSALSRNPWGIRHQVSSHGAKTKTKRHIPLGLFARFLHQLRKLQSSIHSIPRCNQPQDQSLTNSMSSKPRNSPLRTARKSPRQRITSHSLWNRLIVGSTLCLACLHLPIHRQGRAEKPDPKVPWQLGPESILFHEQKVQRGLCWDSFFERAGASAYCATPPEYELVLFEYRSTHERNPAQSAATFIPVARDGILSSHHAMVAEAPASPSCISCQRRGRPSLCSS